jgi:hypothetical protein
MERMKFTQQEQESNCLFMMTNDTFCTLMLVVFYKVGKYYLFSNVPYKK